jgi:formate hydrogenlyase subunit 3/multisubunit Na+/H+ antiporter MnhD subunit
MQVPLTAVTRRSRQVNNLGVIRCALISKPTEAEKHQRAMLRYCVIGIALMAVVFLMAIAIYYTQGNSVTIHHIS